MFFLEDKILHPSLSLTLKRSVGDIILGDMPKPILIKKDSHGETTIQEVKGAQESLTIDRVRYLTGLDPETNSDVLGQLPTHEKVIWLRLKIDEKAPHVTAGANEITVDRENLLSDSLIAFKQISDPQKMLRVTFKNEVSRDVGGISREFFTTIMQELLNESIGLFCTANTEQFSYKVASDSHEIQGNEELFLFFGQLLGKATFDRIPLNLCLNRSLFNALLGLVSQQDYASIKQFKHVDLNVANSLSFVLDNDLAQYGDSVEFYFTTTNETSY